MTTQVLLFDVFFEKDPHLNAVESGILQLSLLLSLTILCNIKVNH